jgi:phosphoribosylaminoimidazolecarboxamide formyltransferase/IMP cyclohydrolase
MQYTHIRRALLSVFDKTGLLPLAHSLHALGVEILASGGTAVALIEQGIPVVKVEDFTGAKEVLGGRVKTLHPKIHAGLLADRNNPEHQKDMHTEGYREIDLVVCNLYPFASYLAQGKSRDALIEKIDIGGPTLVRAAAKNIDGGCTVLVDPSDYTSFAEELQTHGGVSIRTRKTLAAKAFVQVAQYDAAIAQWALKEAGEAPLFEVSGFAPGPVLRYGENPHQKAQLFTQPQEQGGVGCGVLLSGKELSYNNCLDMDAAYRAVHMLQGVGCSIVKHTNPCGFAQSHTQEHAFQAALEGDPVSAFGGIVGFNKDVTLATAQAIKESKLFVECIVAPGFQPEALALLKQRENMRLFQVGAGNPHPSYHAHRIGGGLLVEEADSGLNPAEEWRVVTHTPLQEGWLEELRFAMTACLVLKSNAITVTSQQRLRGAGAGHMSRVDATMQALSKAGAHAQGAFMASDAFFPFNDCVQLAHQAGIVAIVQPGGSKRDQESIDACNTHGIAMVFTGRRHFKH